MLEKLYRFACFARYVGVRPEAWCLIVRDSLGLPACDPPRDPGAGLQAAADWLVEAARHGQGGVASRYSPRFGGWNPAYRETTGYIIPSLHRATSITRDARYEAVAWQLAEWLLHNVREDGGVAGEALPDSGQEPLVFDTGQVLEGVAYAWKYLGETKYQECAARLASWLVRAQDPDGVWRRHVYKGVPHAYHSRVAWAMAEYARHANDEATLACAQRFYDALLQWKLENGFFRYSGFSDEETIWSHTIAYTLEGLVRGGITLGRADLIEAAIPGAQRLLRISEVRGRLPGGYAPDWSITAPEVCLVGYAQMAIVWFLLGRETGDLRYTNAAFKACDVLLKRQESPLTAPARRGALAGSWPIWGGYIPLAYPNWAAKFFVDALDLYLQEQHRLAAQPQQQVPVS